MRRHFNIIYILLFLNLIISVPFIKASAIFESEPVADSVDDGLDFNQCFYGEVLQSTLLPIDIVGVSLDSPEEGKLLTVEVTLTAPLLPHQSYTIEIGVDTDMDPTTGASSPLCFYNGLGVDYDVGVEVIETVVNRKWIDSYESGVWTKIGEPEFIVDDLRLLIKFDLTTIGSPAKAALMTYAITEGALDMAPDFTDPPLVFEFTELPEAKFILPTLVEEGTVINIDASHSTSKRGIISFEWDLNGDGIVDEMTSDPILSTVFPNDGSYSITLTVVDNGGYTSSYIEIVNVENTPPYDVTLEAVTEATAGDIVTFKGSASDKGDDPLTYIWDFGEGTILEGDEVTYIYTSSGQHIIKLTVSDDEGASAQTEATIDVAEPVTQPVNGNGGGGGIDPLLIILIVLFGIAGWFIYNFIKGKKGEITPPKKEEEPEDYCKEHPEVVEAEKHACEDALIDLESAIGDVRDRYDDALPRWQEASRTISRLLVEWDGILGLIAHWTRSEKELIKDAERIQKVAGIVTNAAGKAKTAFKEGGEAVMKEMGQDLAKDIGKSVLGEISSTVGQVLDLEDWAIREIGLGIASGITGIDPRENAVNLRKKSEILLSDLVSWVNHSEAWNSGRRPPDTCQSMLEDIQGMLNAINDFLKDFEDAVKGFKCITCQIPEYLQEEIDKLKQDLEKWQKTFQKLQAEIKKRLDQAKILYSKRDVYTKAGYDYLDKANDHIRRINKTLNEM